ncbi:OmpH family outer membrane protein [uncultured Victivallis sp.]|uniref:OmpH family outer membrane protein n=1 Tax=uncultured Victivallis sp. TaxID=354118 RepID=UPI002587B1A5|nr:OmpH family outer membrane protein [uncultured Victivallis sp.]
MSRRTPVGLLLLAAFLCAGIAAQAAEVQRFAVVNLEKVFREYRKSRIAEDAFKQQAEVYRNYFVKQQGLLVQLRKQAEQLQEEARNPALSEADRSKAGADAVVKAREVAAKEAELKLYAAERLRTMRDAEQKKREEVFADIYKEIDRRAAAEGFTFVLDSSGKTMNEQPTVLRFPASCDLTEAVIRELNRTMSEAEKKEAAPAAAPQPDEKTEPQPE